MFSTNAKIRLSIARFENMQNSINFIHGHFSNYLMAFAVWRSQKYIDSEKSACSCLELQIWKNKFCKNSNHKNLYPSVTRSVLFQSVHGFANFNNNGFSIGYVLGYLLIVWLGPKEQFMHHFGFPIFFGLVLPKSCDFSGTCYLCYLIVFFFFRKNFNFASFFFWFFRGKLAPKTYLWF